MADRFIPLEKWGHAQYGEDMPTIATLRRWARQGKIFPLPKKHGRSYFVTEQARYIENYNDPGIASWLRGTAATQ